MSLHKLKNPTHCLFLNLINFRLMRTKIFIIALTAILYWIIKNYVPYGGYLLYPVTLLVTFFHETGHAFFALITGGMVDGIQINSDGSGYARIGGGWSFLCFRVDILVVRSGEIYCSTWLYTRKSTAATCSISSSPFYFSVPLSGSIP